MGKRNLSVRAAYCNVYLTNMVIYGIIKIKRCDTMARPKKYIISLSETDVNKLQAYHSGSGHPSYSFFLQNRGGSSLP